MSSKVSPKEFKDPFPPTKKSKQDSNLSMEVAGNPPKQLTSPPVVSAQPDADEDKKTEEYIQQLTDKSGEVLEKHANVISGTYLFAHVFTRFVLALKWRR